MTSPASETSAPKWRVLFVCGKNQWRSPTAEAIYRQDPRMEVRSAGVAGEARRKVTARDLEWARIIFTMEPKHSARLRERFPDFESEGVGGGEGEGESESEFPRTLECLGIPDDYEFMDPELVELIRDGVETFLAELAL